MPDVTPKLGLKKPLANETVTRAAHNENLDLIDTNAASQAEVDSHRQAATLDHPDGSVTDAKIGNRTIDDTVAAASGADTPTRLWSKLANMIKKITGKANWWDAPVKTIEQLNTDVANLRATADAALPRDGSQAMTGDLAINKSNANIKGTDLYLFASGKQRSWLLSNAYYDGTNYQRYATDQPAAALSADPVTGKPTFWYGAAGANPITWTAYDVLITQGGQTINGTLKVAAPVDSNDVARKAEIDAIRSDKTKAFVLEVRTSDPVSPEIGRMWVRSDL
ncbi:hypothetical protein FE783_19385 [Paenibacillus mesophilus]|uniref:hypothetical protein n=1 Tax=Paenibacillus mesophilus TaxID=2582849 RepID=UPI00110F5C30|nr:hypothetical protein [Paenibacillus mesophilus]TMV48117.1 hypothetical protein FE783_19385 [Paenibacillus mesophilus]